MRTEAWTSKWNASSSSHLISIAIPNSEYACYIYTRIYLSVRVPPRNITISLVRLFRSIPVARSLRLSNDVRLICTHCRPVTLRYSHWSFARRKNESPNIYKYVCIYVYVFFICLYIDAHLIYFIFFILYIYIYINIYILYYINIIYII